MPVFVGAVPVADALLRRKQFAFGASWLTLAATLAGHYATQIGDVESSELGINAVAIPLKVGEFLALAGGQLTLVHKRDKLGHAPSLGAILRLKLFLVAHILYAFLV